MAAMMMPMITAAVGLTCTARTESSHRVVAASARPMNCLTRTIQAPGLGQLGGQRRQPGDDQERQRHADPEGREHGEGIGDAAGEREADGGAEERRRAGRRQQGRESAGREVAADGMPVPPLGATEHAGEPGPAD